MSVRVGGVEECEGWGPASWKIDGKVPTRMSIAHLPRSREAQQLLSCCAAALGICVVVVVII